MVTHVNVEDQINQSLCGYRDTYILIKGTILVINTTGKGNAANNDKKMQCLKVIFNLNCRKRDTWDNSQPRFENLIKKLP